MATFPEAEINSLVIDSIKSYAKLGSKVESLEQSINLLRSENEKILSKISESLAVLAAIQERLASNGSDHTIIHKRIDDVKTELDGVDLKITQIQRTCNSTGHAELVKRVDAVEKHNKIIDEKLDKIISALRLFTFKVKGIPLWLIIVSMVVVGAAFDVVDHHDLAIKVMGWFK